MTSGSQDRPGEAAEAAPLVSIVSPMKNEAENVALLVDEIEAACTGLWPFEVILVDDGSDDGTGQVIDELRATRPWLKRVHHARSGGQTAAVLSGVRFAKGQIVCTLDGDGQNPPDQLPLLVAPFLAEGASDGLGLVAGQRVERQDTWSKRYASKFANWLRSGLLRDGTRDTGCGLKAFRRDAFLALPFFNHMHRYLPALFARDGWEVAHVDVAHRERHAGTSNYSNIQRGLVGIYDLLGVAWLIRRRRKIGVDEIRLVALDDERSND